MYCYESVDSLNAQYRMANDEQAATTYLLYSRAGLFSNYTGHRRPQAKLYMKIPAYRHGGGLSDSYKDLV